MMVLFPPAPPRPAHTSGFSIFIVIGGGACGVCCAVTEMASEPHTTTASPKQRVFICDIENLSFRGEHSTTSRLGEVIFRDARPESDGCRLESEISQSSCVWPGDSM